jgi:hypothetical protein
VKVFVYCNIRTKQLSIKALEGPFKGKVVAHAEKLQMKDVEFKVSEAGRQRVLKTGRKNVHAGAVGEITAAWGIVMRHPECSPRVVGAGRVWKQTSDWRKVRYNPFEAGAFMSIHRKPVKYANELQMNRCHVQGIGLQ